MFYLLYKLTIQLAFVEEITASDANIFIGFIFPILKGTSSDPSDLVRATFVQCLSSLGTVFTLMRLMQSAETSVRFLELAQILRNAMPSDTEFEEMYQACLFVHIHMAIDYHI